MACEDSRSMELKACESAGQEAQPLGPPSPPTQGSPLLEEGSSMTSSEGESEDAKPKAVKTVDARVSALKALQGISTVVSKSRKVDAEALQQIKQQRARVRAEQASAPAGSASGAQQGEVPLAQCSAQLDELTSSGVLLRHLSLPSAASCGPAEGAAAGAAAALGTASSTSHLVLHPHPFITPPSPFPTLCTNPYPNPLSGLQSAQGAGPAAKLPPSSSSGQLPPLLRPQLSLPANFSPADVSYQSRRPVAPLVQPQPALGDGSGGLPPVLADLLPSLSVQELLSIRSAVEALLLQHAAASLTSSTSLSQAGSAFLDTQQAQRAAQHQAQQAQQQAAYQHAEQVLQHAQREAQALQQLQQAQRAQQASAILQSLSAAAAGGPFSPDVAVLPHPHALLQQRPTPFQSIQEDEQPCASGGGGNLSPITSLDAPGRGSGQTLSPATSGGLGVGEGTTAEQHLLGDSLSSFLDVGLFSSSQPRQQDLSWASIDTTQPLPRSISMPAAPPICTARSASLSSYLGPGAGEPGGTDAATFLFSSLQIEAGAPPHTPSMRAAAHSHSQSPPTPGLHTHSPSLMAPPPAPQQAQQLQQQQAGLNLPPQQPRVGVYRSVRFHEMGRPAQACLPQANQ